MKKYSELKRSAEDRKQWKELARLPSNQEDTRYATPCLKNCAK